MSASIHVATHASRWRADRAPGDVRLDPSRHAAYVVRADWPPAERMGDVRLDPCRHASTRRAGGSPTAWAMSASNDAKL
jgi:hypothetical protein